MAALLVGLAVMAVVMSMAMPVWKQASQREKEEELIFRGKQYARALELYSRKMPGAMPLNLDVLLDQKFLRKKYKDPITGQDFDIVSPNSPGAQQGIQPTPGATRPGQTAPTMSVPAPATQTSRFGGPGGTVGVQPGIVGVVSKSKETSIRIYNGRTHYNEWVFQYIPRQQAPGAGGGPQGTPGRGRGDGRGAPPNPGGRGSQNPGGSPFSPNPGTGRNPAPQPMPFPQPQRPPGD